MPIEMIELDVMTPGLVLAIDLYGSAAVISYGSHLVPGKIRIPKADAEAFMLLEEEAVLGEIQTSSSMGVDHAVS